MRNVLKYKKRVTNKGGDYGQFTINTDESIVEFKDGKTIYAKSKSSKYFDEYFLPSGQYSCIIDTEGNLPFEVLNIKVVETEKEVSGKVPTHACEFQRDGNKLIFIVHAANESTYPANKITYTFHQKK